MHDPQLVALCRAEHPRLVGLLMLHLRDRGVAEELAQEALLKLCQRWPAVREMANPSGWLATVATNLARSALRRRAAEVRARSRHGASPTSDEGLNPGIALEIREAVASLPPRQRAAVVYRYFAGLSVAETAAAMSAAEGTVRSLTHQAITALRATGWEIKDEEAIDAGAR